jgi:hypothetical protein
VSDQYAPCSVCGEQTSEHSNAMCNFCFRPYHLALRNDIPAKDCGQVWISEEHMSLEFACNTCIGQQSVPTAKPATLTETPKPRYARREGKSASAIVREKQRRTRR